MKIQSKYNRGDSVYCADTIYNKNKIACPDCLGKLKWKITFADGEELEIACQTCRDGYGESSGFVSYREHQPNVNLLTIGTIRYNEDDKEPFSYMCEETGIGSGRVYYENKDLFSTKEEATKRAEEMYVERMKEIGKNNFSKRFGGTKELEKALSTFGYGRKEKMLKLKQFREWIELSSTK